ncbi:hypothetical protein DPMN_107158 [Dreissena polymorpha]|uniref:Uncharacterized protein n=1 Tax=Dreissena polymorpha TaxID=45954 RepID=A0A9D4K679_DREPO|nr:hypothetical protein DPMN_107158 [Dreissena polymorpha]
MEMLVQNLFSLAIGAVGIAIRTSAVLVPSLDRIAPRYLKLVTYSNFSSFMVMSVLVLVVLFTMIFDFSVLTSIPYTCTHKANFISESQFGDGSSTDEDRGVVVMESLMQYLLNEKVEQDRREQTSLTGAH